MNVDSHLCGSDVFLIHIYHHLMVTVCFLCRVYEEVFAPIHVDGLYISNNTIGHDEKI